MERQLASSTARRRGGSTSDREVGRRGIAERPRPPSGQLAAPTPPIGRQSRLPPPRRLARARLRPPWGSSSWSIVGLLAGGLARRAVGTPQARMPRHDRRRASSAALIAGAASRLATGDDIDTFQELDLGSIFVAFIGACALLLVLEAASGRRHR